MVRRALLRLSVAFLVGGISSNSVLCQNPLNLQDKLTPIPQLPFQNNTTFGIGPQEGLLNALNLQPVYPVRLGGFNLINRAILPVIYRGELRAGAGDLFGLGDLSYTAFFTPAERSSVIWGIGPSILIPTATDEMLGTGKWSAGAGLVLFVKEGRWLIGALAQNVWSFAGDSGRADVNRLLAQYFINYGIDDLWYLTSEPTIMADWNAPAERRWIVPVGGGFGRVFPSESLPANLIFQGFFNVERPAGWGEWAARIELKLFFPPGGVPIE